MMHWLSGLLLLAAAAAPARAQSLRDKMETLFRFGSCDQPLCLTVPIAQHNGHFINSVEETNQNLLGFLGGAIAASVGAIPISATSGGATFSLRNGVPVRTSLSAGPIFAERAQTLGRGRLLVGGNTSGIDLSSVRGVSMDRLNLNFTHSDIPTQNRGRAGLGDPAFEDDVINAQPSIDLRLQVTSLFVTYGLLDNLDVGVAIPFVYSALDATSRGAIVTDLHSPPSPHAFGNGGLVDTSAVRGSAAGVGDVAARVKLNVRSSERLGAALLADARFPSGKAEEFAGAGFFSLRAVGILSSRRGNFSPHLNAGYAYRAGTIQNSAVLATLGFDHLVAPWMTAAVDLISEWQVGEARLELPSSVHYSYPERTVRTTNIPVQRDDVMNASAGARFAVRDFSILANAIVPLRDAGMQPNLLWTVGLERAF
jgi:hypothetical protein